MSNLPLQPIEFDDLSGGETDFFLLGGKNRYEKATNFLIDVDKKLFQRPGSQGFDFNLNHVLPNAPTRLGSFLFYDNEKELLVQQAQNIYYLNSSWQEIRGPENAPAVGNSKPFDSLTFSEWKGHTCFASGGGGRPGKLYRDETGTFQVRTLGLPLPVSTPVFSKNTLLGACIALANELRASMVAHINDLNIHYAVDKWSLSYFSTQTFNSSVDPEYPGPLPTPTPAPAASDEASLYALIAALNLAYEHHGKEVGEALYYHDAHTVTLNGNNTTPAKGPFSLLTDSGEPDELADAVTQLNELRMKWNWHRLGLFTHSATNDYAAINLYPISLGEIKNATFDSIPYVVPNYTEVFRYANYLKKLYNEHLVDSAVHVQPEVSTLPQTCNIPDALDLETAYIITYWVWASYGFIHLNDAAIKTHTNTTIDTAAGSADVTDVGGGALVLAVGSWVVSTSAIFSDPDPTKRYAAKVLVSGAGTATLSKLAIGTVNNQAVQYSLSTYHANYASGAFASNTTDAMVTSEETPDPILGSGYYKNNLNAVPTSLGGWIELMSTTFTMLAAHTANAKAHKDSHLASDYLSGDGPFYKPQIASYGYAFVNKHTYYTKDGILFREDSEPIFVGSVVTGKQYPANTSLDTGFTTERAETLELVSTNVETVASTMVRNLPRVRNTSLTNYAVEEIEVEIYRTQDGGNSFFLIGSVANGTTEFEDVVSDTTATVREAALSDREPLYTTGGEVSHTQAPESRFMHILENTAYYGYIFDTGQTFSNRIVQSIPGAPYTGPGDFTLDLDDELVGISSCRNNVIALCKHNLYRLTGGYNNLGQGSLDQEKIGDRIGCISTKSIVQTELGVFFAGTDGFYFTDGFQLIKISIDRDLTYAQRTQTEVQASRISGAYDRLGRRIWWSMQSEPTGQDVDESHVYHLNYGVKPSGAFTSMANGTHWSPTAMVFFQGQMLRGDRRGLIFRHDKRWGSDPKIPSGTEYEDFLAIDQWGTIHVPYLYRSCAMDFGKMSSGSYVTKIKLMGKNVGNAAVQVNAIADNNNFNPSKKPLAPMLYQPNPRWGDPTVMWGTSDYNWKYDGKLDMFRRFPSGNLRSQLKQIEICPARVGLYKYDDYPEDSFVAVDKDTLKVTITTPEDYSLIVFPYDVIDMYIAFEDDEYENEYLITAWAQEELTITDPDGDLLDSLEMQKWVIRGYMKESSLAPLGYVLHLAFLGERGSPYPGASGRGENG